MTRLIGRLAEWADTPGVPERMLVADAVAEMVTELRAARWTAERIVIAIHACARVAAPTPRDTLILDTFVTNAIRLYYGDSSVSRSA